MREGKSHRRPGRGLSRRRFLGAGLAAGGILAARVARGAEAGRRGGPERPNILVILTDQQGLDALSAHGCPDVRTPNLDRLVRRGTSFLESYTTNPLCSPARSSLLTGRMPSETGVIRNNRPIRAGIPNLGQWLRRAGYRTVYSGKWHLPEGFTDEVPGFEVLPAGLGGQGTVGDQVVSSACEGFLRNRRGVKEPFLLVASFLQPHDICNWIARHEKMADPPALADLAGPLPALPANFEAVPRPLPPRWAPRRLAGKWSPRLWRYYLWSYYRMVEEVDAEIGRLLDALEATGLAERTLVLFTADHGEGRGRHGTVTKNFLYEEAVKVPMVVAWPGVVRAGVQDREHLVSGLDLVPTVCDYAGVEPPPKGRGRSLRPLLEGRATAWRDVVVAEARYAPAGWSGPGVSNTSPTGTTPSRNSTTFATTRARHATWPATRPGCRSSRCTGPTFGTGRPRWSGPPARRRRSRWAGRRPVAQGGRAARRGQRRRRKSGAARTAAERGARPGAVGAPPRRFRL